MCQIKCFALCLVLLGTVFVPECLSHAVIAEPWDEALSVVGPVSPPAALEIGDHLLVSSGRRSGSRDLIKMRNMSHTPLPIDTNGGDRKWKDDSNRVQARGLRSAAPSASFDAAGKPNDALRAQRNVQT
jgi:hypothetical protein